MDKQSTKLLFGSAGKAAWKRRKRPEIFDNNSWILQHVNAPAHMVLFVGEFLATKQRSVLEHPANLPDLAPVTFSVTENKGNIERKAFWIILMTSGVIHGTSEDHSTKLVPKLFWRVD